MTTIERTVRVRRPLPRVFAYLCDFTSTNDWDPGTVRTVRQSGDGGPGTVYLNTSRFAGRETQVTYTVQEVEENRLVRLRGVNKSLVTHDTMTFRETEDGTEVRYVAQFDFKGWAKVAEPFLAPAFKRLGDEAEQGLREALERL